MIKKTQSIDGFTLKRREGTPLDAGDRRVFLDYSSPKPKPEITPETILQKTRTDTDSTTLSADVEESLRGLGNDLDQLPEPGKESRRAKKLRRHQARLNRKKHHPIRRIIKWFFTIILILFLVLVGWLTFKALITGGKIFQGNILDVFTSKTRLEEDSNGRTNIVIFGTSGYSMAENAWDGALLTDSIMVISVDQDKHDAYMISLPRDLYVKHTCRKLLGTSAGKLNETYYCAYTDSKKNEDKGAEALREKAGEILGLDVQYYVHANWTALERMVDSVGGVDVVIKSDNAKGIYDRNTGIKLPNGEVHLSGKEALMLARSRGDMGGYGVYSNFDREMNQQKVLTALQQKALSAGTLANPITVNSLLDALGDNLRTNFKASEIQTLIDLAKKTKTSNMISLPLVDRGDGEKDLVTTGMLGDISIVRPAKGLYDYSDIIDYVQQSINANSMSNKKQL